MFDLSSIDKLVGIVYPTERIRSNNVHAAFFLGTDNNIMCTLSVSTKKINTIDFSAFLSKTGSNIYTASATFSTDDSSVVYSEIVGIIYRKVVSFAPMAVDAYWEADMPVHLNCSMFKIITAAIRLSAATTNIESRYNQYKSGPANNEMCVWHLVGTSSHQKSLIFNYRKTEIDVQQQPTGRKTIVEYGNDLQYNTTDELFRNIIHSEIAHFLRILWKTILLLSEIP